MQYDADIGGFGQGGNGGTCEPLQLIRQMERRGGDRNMAFNFLTETYVNQGCMSMSVRSKILAKVYNRIRSFSRAVTRKDIGVHLSITRPLEETVQEANTAK